ncbi:hypothetical protein tinsulaeT_21890 [Thalassotalea insulae]|uniref:Cadherin domain-containing protein n=1 Tax=Thalassotalea insulae TaxID=2056778 RepID=A0ABQ6GUJ7_9GAMM|nr:DUF4856 domain-containing protein [Thalassotalea insulae]GLX78849.1 hypothetical protein tinsulaeT_21890 [Thalassotalea insulae]
MTFKKSLLASTLVTLFTVTACGGGGSSKKDTPVTPSNTAPTDISISANSVDENVAGAEIGVFSATDANSGDTFTYTVEGELFTVDGSTLMLAEGKQVNFEQATSHKVNVTVTDNGGLSFTKELTIDVNDVLDTYSFASKFEDGSSVSYSGQIARHVLIAELNNYIGSTLKTEVEDDIITSKQDVLDRLNKFFRTTEEQYDNFPITFTSGAKQGFITDISGSHKNLVGKIAGRDEKGQHKAWGNKDVASDAFIGWGTQGTFTPETLVDMFFEQLADNVDYYLTVGNNRVSDTGDTITEFYINTDGTDLKQLIQKFLLMSVAYSQATDDYFGHEAVDVYGNDLTGSKGLLTDNTGAVSGKAYTNLEHQFDEGFGYFGAARDYLEYNDNELAGKVSSDDDGRADWNGKHDSDGDGEIDLTAEFNFGNSVNAAKRDRGTKSNTNPTDYTTDAMSAFLAGRALINDNAGHALTDEQMETLKGYAKDAIDAWENAVAATVVHYINDVSSDLSKLGTDEFSYSNTAKHWSELKGFALGLQFNPYSPLSDQDFATLHGLVGDAPVLTVADVDEYQTKLIQARDIIAAAYSFDAENVTNW